MWGGGVVTEEESQKMVLNLGSKIRKKENGGRKNSSAPSRVEPSQDWVSSSPDADTEKKYGKTRQGA